MQMTQTQMKHYHYTFNIQTLYDSVHVVQYTLVLKILYFHCFFSSFFSSFLSNWFAVHMNDKKVYYYAVLLKQ